MGSIPTVVLVHGAFTDASGYAGVIRELQTQAVEVRAPMNPLRSLAFDADAVARYTTTVERPIILVGHSYGGAVISQAAPAIRGVIALVFLSAFAPDIGESCASVQEPFPASLLASTSVPSPYDAPGAPRGPDLFIRIPDFHQTFCADLPAGVAAPMAVSQRPLSAAALTEKATAAGWKDLPTWYMLSEQDNAIPPDCQRFMARRMNAYVEPVSKGSHAAFIAHPDIAASLILRAIEAASGPI
jgi:pimeloyl-ACP methyl ester carboxylesterase